MQRHLGKRSTLSRTPDRRRCDIGRRHAARGGRRVRRDPAGRERDRHDGRSRRRRVGGRRRWRGGGGGRRGRPRGGRRWRKRRRLRVADRFAQLRRVQQRLHAPVERELDGARVQRRALRIRVHARLRRLRGQRRRLRHPSGVGHQLRSVRRELQWRNAGLRAAGRRGRLCLLERLRGRPSQLQRHLRRARDRPKSLRLLRDGVQPRARHRRLQRLELRGGRVRHGLRRLRPACLDRL
jgi:hypothetical protein